MEKAIACVFTISPFPVTSWQIPRYGYFTVSRNGFNPRSDRFEIWQRISKSKALLITHAEHPIERIPVIIGGLLRVVYPVFEEWQITGLHPDKGFVNN